MPKLNEGSHSEDLLSDSDISWEDISPTIEDIMYKRTLVIHYVEEFLQDVRQRKLIPQFNPIPRVRKSQLIEIAYLVFEHLFPIYTQNEAVTQYNLNVELEVHKFPLFIQDFFLKFMCKDCQSQRIRQEQLLNTISEAHQALENEFRGKYIGLRVLVAKMEVEFKSGSLSMQEIKQKHNSEIWDSMVKCELQLMHPHESIIIREHITKLGWVKGKIVGNLSKISFRDAERLINLLKCGTQLFKTVPLFNRLDYCMKIEDEEKKNLIFMDAGRKLESLYGKIPEEECQELHKVHNFSRRRLSRSDYSFWKEYIFTKLTKLPPLSVQVLDDIIFDASRCQLLEDSRRKSLQETYGKVNEDFLSPELKERLDTLSEMWRIHEVEIRILTQEPLKN
ncbi:hypothetical protein PGT21_014835 [Puccinia graminis f. sp. tritici]|uniref:Uncharacterized protein n=1 Tax=Puccinia graminis f. sp. tritici TaxID=56615 RepID=A0A5B0P1L0_PUCGR|nr:hypothetical protein PGTUg99_012929 [Puccinia graminis f. sp. tritici]KAA1099617.1 hypothetical protein PGT21_014835 [Puccinia graminis f. sp. tritici]